MPIRINLLAEALAEEDLRRRDPVKRACFIGAFLVVLSLVWYSSIWLKQIVRNNELNQVKSQLQSLSKNYTEAQINQKNIADANKRLLALQQLSSTRFLQGNLLNALQQAYVPHVQLLRIRVDQTYHKAEADKAKAAASPTAEHILMNLDAKDSSSNPGDQIQKIKEVLSHLNYFEAALNPTNGIRLAGPPQQISADGKSSYVQFTFECFFRDITR